MDNGHCAIWASEQARDTVHEETRTITLTGFDEEGEPIDEPKVITQTVEVPGKPVNGLFDTIAISGEHWKPDMTIAVNLQLYQNAA